MAPTTVPRLWTMRVATGGSFVYWPVPRAAGSAVKSSDWRGELRLTELEVSRESNALTAGIHAIQREIHVRLRVARLAAAGDSQRAFGPECCKGWTHHHDCAEHLRQLSDFGRKASDGIDDADEGEQEEGEEDRHDESPPRKVRVAGVCRR